MSEHNENMNITINPEPIPAPSGAVDRGGTLPQQEKVFGDIPFKPTQEAVEGIRFDFCDGLRVMFPESGEYRLTFIDADTGIIVYNCDTQPGSMVASVKKFFVRFRLEIRRKNESEILFAHDFDCKNKEVLIQLPFGTLGDSIAWFSYIERFARQNKCRVICSLSPPVRAIVEKQYPEITFIDKSETVHFQPYAAYCLGLFFRGDVDHQPFDFRQVGLHRTAGHILGVEDLSDIPPRFDLSTERTVKKKYVAIAAQASSQCKYWNNPHGWRVVVDYLKSRGYRVLCVDQRQENGQHYVWNHIPYGAEDFTGDLPLQERINIIKDADMFIGLSSGLSWLAWGCQVPVILISGFTDPLNEFYTPYRIINTSSCHGCWNDTRCEFDHFDFLWCPRHRNNPEKQFECSRMITDRMIIRAIEKIIKQKRSRKK